MSFVFSKQREFITREVSLPMSKCVYDTDFGEATHSTRAREAMAKLFTVFSTVCEILAAKQRNSAPRGANVLCRGW
jgi:hypothetical protein